MHSINQPTKGLKNMLFPDWLPVYGDVSYRGDCPKEDVELSTFFNQLRKIYPDIAKRAWHT